MYKHMVRKIINDVNVSFEAFFFFCLLSSQDNKTAMDPENSTLHFLDTLQKYKNTRENISNELEQALASFDNANKEFLQQQEYRKTSKKVKHVESTDDQGLEATSSSYTKRIQSFMNTNTSQSCEFNEELIRKNNQHRINLDIGLQCPSITEQEPTLYLGHSNSCQKIIDNDKWTNNIFKSSQEALLAMKSDLDQFEQFNQSQQQIAENQKKEFKVYQVNLNKAVQFHFNHSITKAWKEWKRVVILMRQARQIFWTEQQLKKYFLIWKKYWITIRKFCKQIYFKRWKRRILAEKDKVKLSKKNYMTDFIHFFRSQLFQFVI
ncbi:hypothetical protein RFI_13283 [Reticulomyxa filosa]|uniref:Uncharacterized protein n=1 Tax=Reticulomyxa filosa TaxID=46433 RepID=X6NC66_RETFI|nr:hypothetical protein RFI_13283 [Reticulomyxa filosa]|eukprot:ETO23875.1 hypothetical protein RFI_13283 [Reticulomyxa filosa]